MACLSLSCLAQVRPTCLSQMPIPVVSLPLRQAFVKHFFYLTTSPPRLLPSGLAQASAATL